MKVLPRLPLTGWSSAAVDPLARQRRLLWLVVRYREQQPTFIPPMLLTSRPLPSGDAGTLELKWDGCRAQLR